MPENPAARGWRAYSQCDEDGIIRECLRRIESVVGLSRTFIEVGCADGLENNTHQLALDGFAGCWIDGDAAKIGFVETELDGLLAPGLKVLHAFVTLESIGAIMKDCRAFLATDDIDFLSFDIDGNDTHLVRAALGSIRPKLLCVEYNAKFRPPTLAEMNYSAAHRWTGDDYFGASLQTWVDTLVDYRLVACNLSGANAFFVRTDLSGVFEARGIDELYQPPRDEERLPDIVKSDTQGSEARILRGARGTFAKGWRPVLLLEFWPFGLAHSGGDPLLLWTALRAMNYEMCEVSESNPRLMALSEERLRYRLASDIAAASGGFTNILALPAASGRHDRIRDLID